MAGAKAKPSNGVNTQNGTPKRGNPATLAPAWQPGKSGNPNGRPKGSRNKLGEDFLSALQADFSEHGVAVIETVRTERPHEYLKVIAGILPKELKVTTTRVEEMTDDELADGIAALQAIIAAQAIGERDSEKARH